MTKKLPVIQNSSNYELKDEFCETPTGVSLTVPDDSYTIRELLDRATKGINPMIERSGEYGEDPVFDDPDFEKILDLDYADLDAMRRDFHERRAKAEADLKDVNDKYNALEREKAQREFERQYTLFEEEKKSKTSTTPATSSGKAGEALA